jgi:hypothetical protein
MQQDAYWLQRHFLYFQENNSCNDFYNWAGTELLKPWNESDLSHAEITGIISMDASETDDFIVCTQFWFDSNRHYIHVVHPKVLTFQENRTA